MRKLVLFVVMALVALAMFVLVTPMLPEGSGVRDFGATLADGLAALWGLPIRP